MFLPTKTHNILLSTTTPTIPTPLAVPPTLHEPSHPHYMNHPTHTLQAPYKQKMQTPPVASWQLHVVCCKQILHSAPQTHSTARGLHRWGALQWMCRHPCLLRLVGCRGWCCLVVGPLVGWGSCMAVVVVVMVCMCFRKRMSTCCFHCVVYPTHTFMCGFAVCQYS